jgi:hypothetical protein
MEGIPELPDRPAFGHLQLVPNVDARFGSASHYVRVLTYDPEAEEFITLLLTEADMRTQEHRRSMNPEECIEPGPMDKLKARV